MTNAARDGDQDLPGKGVQKGGLFRASTLRSGELIAVVKPHWQKLSDAERQKLLTIPEALAYSAAGDGLQYPRPKGIKAEEMARREEIYEQFSMARNELLEGKAMFEWRWTVNDIAYIRFATIDDFWEQVEGRRMEGDLLDTLPRISRHGSIDQPVLKRLQKFLCELSEKILHAQTQKLAERRKSRIPRSSGDFKNHCQNLQIEVIIMILEELQTHPILYQYIQARMQKGINDVRLPNAKLETHFNIQTAYTVLSQLQDGALARMGEWLVDKVDEFKSLAQELQDGGDVKNSKETYVLVSDPIAEKGKSPKYFTVDTKWLEHLKVSKVDTSRCLRGGADQLGSQLDETGLQLEWLFGAVISDPVVTQDQAKRSAGLQPYWSEAACEALQNALKAQKECQLARESARLVALEILEHRKELQNLLKSYPDMYTVRPEDDKGSEDDREVPDDVLLFMLSRELHLVSAKIIINNSSSARATSDFGAFIEHMEEITHQTNKLDWEMSCDQYYESDESLNDPEERLEGHQAEEIIEEQEKQSLPDETESKTAAVSKGYQEKEMSAVEPEKLTLQLWADWTLMQRDKLKILMLAESQSGRGTDKKEVADLLDSTEAAAATAEVCQEPLPPSSTLTPQQEDWRRNLRKHFNKMSRPRLLLEKADKELFTELSKEIKAIELLLENGKASLQLLEKHFENAAFQDMHAELSCVILPLMAERVLRWAKDENESFASQAKQDLLHEEQVRAEKKKEKEAKKTKAKERKLEKHAAFKAAGKENMPPEEGVGAEQTMPEEPTALSWLEQEPRTNLIQVEQKAKSENGDMSWLLGDADELDCEPSSDFIGSLNAFKVVQKKTRRSKEHFSSRGQRHRPSTVESDCDNPQEAVLVLPMQMPSPSQTSSKKLVRPRPPPV